MDTKDFNFISSIVINYEKSIFILKTSKNYRPKTSIQNINDFIHDILMNILGNETLKYFLFNPILVSSSFSTNL